VDIGSDVEAAEMSEMTNRSLDQKMFRDFDSRRYSMYFNRYSSYHMALNEEQESGTVIHS
jgi:hypothetical protein